jgi:predicted NUDIX family NTP pyrophosphohydrolase
MFQNAGEQRAGYDRDTWTLRKDGETVNEDDDAAARRLQSAERGMMINFHGGQGTRRTQLRIRRSG